MINFSTKKEGIWFYFDESNESLGGVCLRLLTPAEEDNIAELTTKKKMKPIRGIMAESVDVNERQKNDLTYDCWIMDWKEIQLDGKTMQCNKPNKLRMMAVTDFARFVLDGIIGLTETNKTVDEARVKNLEGTSSGVPKK